MNDSGPKNRAHIADSYRLTFTESCLARIIYWFFMLLHATYRYRYFNLEYRDAATRAHPKGSFAMAQWHEHIFASLGGHSHQRLAPIISHSRDGEIVAQIAEKMHMHPARGSSSKGGAHAKAKLEAMLGSGYVATLTVDGPRGPRRKAKLGILAIGRSSGCQVVPLVALASSYWTLKSWDQFQIPKPFARIAIVYNHPLSIPQSATSKAELVKLKVELETKINEIDSSEIFEQPLLWRRGMKRRQLLGRYRYDGNGNGIIITEPSLPTLRLRDQ